MYHQTPDPNVLRPFPNAQTDNPPYGKFTSNTYQSQQNSNVYNFDSAFGKNMPLIDRRDLRNKNEVLHNNLHSYLQSEYIVDYNVDIDSKDRDCNTFKDPFKYNVTFAPVTKGVTRNEEWIDPMNKSLGKHMIETVYQGNPAPHILRTFKNIKYIRVDSVILPKYCGITFDTYSGTWILDTTKDLSKDRYVVMKLKNIDSRYNLSTNTTMESSGIKLIPDTIPISGNFYYAIPANSNNSMITFNSSSLGNLDRLYIEFYDSTGMQLKYDNLDNSVAITDVRNPENINLQHNITFVFGIVENELATEVNF